MWQLLGTLLLPRSKLGLFYRVLAAFLLVFIIFMVTRSHSVVGSCESSEVTTGSHIIKIQTGTGFDQQTGAVEGEKCSFRVGETLYIVFHVKTQENGATVTLKLFLRGDQEVLEDTSYPVQVEQGTHAYAKAVNLNGTGSHRVELDYNGVSEGDITFTVTS